MIAEACDIVCNKVVCVVMVFRAKVTNPPACLPFHSSDVDRVLTCCTGVRWGGAGQGWEGRNNCKHS